jgi:hypothetical protein
VEASCRGGVHDAGWGRAGAAGGQEAGTAARRDQAAARGFSRDGDAQAEVAEMFKAMAGKWSCTGKAADMASGKEIPISFTMTTKMDLDNFWIQSSMASKKTKESPMAYKFTSYTTYDAKTKSWQRLSVDNMGMWETDTSTGLQGQTINWEGKTVGGGMSMQVKHVDEMKGPKEMAIKGSMSMDGKSWMPSYEATCKK